ncbi:MAG: hypothetical protein JW908_08405 [Anaerolineales bacterium]|nr:hypothetical protein [Anaerolineales bacterium]
MSISGIASSGTTNAASMTASAVQSATTSAFDTDTFMQLLLAELRNQDPLEPMNNSEMVAQLAQLNSLQELTSISANIETMKDYMEALLGISG